MYHIMIIGYFMIHNHHVIIVAGLGNNVAALTWATRGWKRYGLTPHVFNAKWTEEEPELQLKLNRAIRLVDELTARGDKVSLLGNSAGSSFVVNLYAARIHKIHKVVINCGRIRTGGWLWFTFDQTTKHSPSLKESVVRSEKVIGSLTTADKKKILTMRPLFDEVVPWFTVPIPGTKNVVTPSVEHLLSIALHMTVFRSVIINFLQT